MRIEPKIKQSEFIKIPHEIKSCRIKYKNAIKLVGEIGGVQEKNTATFIWIQGNFVFGDFIIQYITENDLDVEELTIITLSISSDSIKALSSLLAKGWVSKINFMVSEYFVRTEKIKHTKSILELETATNQSDDFKVYTTNTHQKIILLKLKDGNKIVMHGSANMKGSQNYEQLMIDNSDVLYDFNYQYFTNLIDQQNGKIR